MSGHFCVLGNVYIYVLSHHHHRVTLSDVPVL